MSTKNIFQTSSTNESSLHRIFVFNSKFAGRTEETEHEKILYFYPYDSLKNFFNFLKHILENNKKELV
jgi:hypothetical protein